MSSTPLRYSPLYLQVKEVLLKRIVDGLYKPGELIPSEPKLATDFDTSVSTIRQALSLLVADGVLVKKQGKGTPVSDQENAKSRFSAGWGKRRPRRGDPERALCAKFEEKYPPIADRHHPERRTPETRATLIRLIVRGWRRTSRRSSRIGRLLRRPRAHCAAPSRACSAGESHRRLPGQDLFGGTYQDQIYSARLGTVPDCP